MLAEAERAGATIGEARTEVFWGGYSGVFVDPDGFLWEVAWESGPPDRLSGSRHGRQWYSTSGSLSGGGLTPNLEARKPCFS